MFRTNINTIDAEITAALDEVVVLTPSQTRAVKKVIHYIADTPAQIIVVLCLVDTYGPIVVINIATRTHNTGLATLRRIRIGSRGGLSTRQQDGTRVHGLPALCVTHNC